MNQIPQPARGRNGFSISEYHDTAEIYRKLDLLLSQPPRSIERSKMNECLQYYEDKCSRSKSVIDQAMDVIPGGM